MEFRLLGPLEATDGAKTLVLAGRKQRALLARLLLDVMVTVDDPKGSKSTYGFKTAGMVVAPVVGRIVQRIGPPLGVIPDMNKDIDLSVLTGEIHDEAKEE